MTTLQELKAAGGIVSDALVQKEIQWSIDGGDQLVASIHVKQLSVGDFEQLIIDDKNDRSHTAQLISRAIFLGEDGNEKLTYTDAYKLHPRLAEAMCKAFNEVNGSKKS